MSVAVIKDALAHVLKTDKPDEAFKNETDIDPIFAAQANKPVFAVVVGDIYGYLDHDPEMMVTRVFDRARNLCTITDYRGDSKKMGYFYPSLDEPAVLLTWRVPGHSSGDRMKAYINSGKPIHGMSASAVLPDWAPGQVRQDYRRQVWAGKGPIYKLSTGIGDEVEIYCSVLSEEIQYWRIEVINYSYVRLGKGEKRMMAPGATESAQRTLAERLKQEATGQSVTEELDRIRDEKIKEKNEREAVQERKEREESKRRFDEKMVREFVATQGGAPSNPVLGASGVSTTSASPQSTPPAGGSALTPTATPAPVRQAQSTTAQSGAPSAPPARASGASTPPAPGDLPNPPGLHPKQPGAIESPAPGADIKVASWLFDSSTVEISFYSYPNGKSGYYKVTNNTTKNLRVSFSYTSNAGQDSGPLSTPVKAGASATGSCFNAGTANIGIKSCDVSNVKIE